MRVDDRARARSRRREPSSILPARFGSPPGTSVAQVTSIAIATSRVERERRGARAVVAESPPARPRRRPRRPRASPPRRRAAPPRARRTRRAGCRAPSRRRGRSAARAARRPRRRRRRRARRRVGVLADPSRRCRCAGRRARAARRSPRVLARDAAAADHARHVALAAGDHDPLAGQHARRRYPPSALNESRPSSLDVRDRDADLVDVADERERRRALRPARARARTTCRACRSSPRRTPRRRRATPRPPAPRARRARPRAGGRGGDPGSARLADSSRRAPIVECSMTPSPRTSWWSWRTSGAGACA